MSILLEALKKKNSVTPQLDTAAKVSPESLKATESPMPLETISSSHAGDELSNVVAELAITPPEGLKWELNRPIERVEVHVEAMNVNPSAESTSDFSLKQSPAPSTNLAFELVLPTSSPDPVVTPQLTEKPRVQPLSLDLPNNHHNRASSTASLASEPEAPPQTIPDQQTEKLATIAVETEQVLIKDAIADKALDDVVLIEPISPPNDMAIQYQEPVVLTQIGKPSPSFAKQLLAFTKKSKQSESTTPSNDNQTVQHNAHKAIAYRKSSQFLMISAGLLVAFSGLILVSFHIWETQEAARAQQLARFSAPPVVSPALTSPAVPVVATSDVAKDEIKPLNVMSANSVSQQPEDIRTPVAEKAVGESQASAKPTVAITSDKTPHLITTEAVRISNKTQSITTPRNSTAKTPGAPMEMSQTMATAEMLNQAYQAWQSGQFQQAEQLYRQVLEKQPQQRDALLGLLAVSQMNSGSQSLSQSLAEQLNRLYPKDREVRLATSGLLPSSVVGTMAESELKQNINSQPTAAAHYRLGVTYAQEQRWPDAQAAFFEAVRLEPNSFEYRLNLAISYDHLGKFALAIDHYQQSLNLAISSNSKKTQAMIMDRINAISSLIKQGEAYDG